MTRSSAEIREAFLNYFEKNGHLRLRSSSLVPLNDPTLLFTNAGMNQFKDVFVGNVARPAPCATTTQKCMRVSGKHNDLENVGRTARHHTFFEMLGNFSFGDYFKEKAIQYSWELVNEMGFDISRMYATVFEEDDEAYDIWHKQIGLPEDRVVRMGAKDNFWSMGDVGPCGPCSELHIDQGEGPDGIWANEDIYGDSDRFLEIWNLVFMQFDRAQDGTMTPLPKPSVDTGGGLERFCAVLNGVYSNYETDLFLPIIQKTAEMCGKTYKTDREDDTSLQVIADHIRATTFLIGDGMLPSNEFRGYVLRRIMRRAIRHGKRLGFDRVFLPDICELVIERMGEVYPELQRNRDFILNVVREEEKGFRRTLNTGLDILQNEIERLQQAGEEQVPGDVAFKLYDTYGFPVDLTQIIASENGKQVDKPGFDKAMKEQRERGRASWKGKGGNDRTALYGEALTELEQPVQFTGYDNDVDTATVRAIISGDQRLQQAPEGMDVELVLDRTPFYAESGGQLGDRGLILSDNVEPEQAETALKAAMEGREVDWSQRFAMLVLDTQKPVDGLWVHKGRILKGSLSVGDQVSVQVDAVRRDATRRNHSATHLLQYALRKVLGEHVKQSGSFVGPDRLRFDFTHFQALEAEQIAEVERLVNEKILVNEAIGTEVKSLEQAQADGAIAFFGEKYGDVVRVVSMTKDSVELCGGTHAHRTGDLGLFTILSEASIASGVRRIEAATGTEAVKAVQAQGLALKTAAGLLSVAPLAVPDGIRSMFEQQKADRKRIEQLMLEKAKMQSTTLMNQVEEINGVRLLCAKVEDVDAKNFRDYGQQALDKLGEGVVLLASIEGEKAGFLLGVSESLRKRLPAGKTIGQVAQAAGGRGGGRPDMAQAGGGDAGKVELAFKALRDLIAGL